jgi:hypothetical protein
LREGGRKRNVLQMIIDSYAKKERNLSGYTLCLTGLDLLFGFEFHALQAGRAENN